MKTITATITAWVPAYTTLADIYGVPDSVAINALSYSTHDMCSQGWTRVGEATITVELVKRSQMVVEKVDALRTVAAGIRAEGERRAMEVEHEIGKLLAIGNDVPSASEADLA